MEQRDVPKGVAGGQALGALDIGEVPLDERKMIKGVDDAIIAIEFEMKRKMSAIRKTEQKIELSENEKIKIGNEYALHRNIKRLIDYFKKTINAHLGKIPPQAVDLEESVLGALILEKPGFDQVKNFLQPEHFYMESNRIVYRAALELGSNQVDMRTIVHQLRKTGHLELIGGPSYIAELTSKVSSSANIEYHARVVIEYAVKRELILLQSRVALDAYDDKISCFDLLDTVKESINRIDQWMKK
jgi:hypothetical protein